MKENENTPRRSIKASAEASLDLAAAKIGDFPLSAVMLACGLTAAFMPDVPVMRESQAAVAVVGVFLGGGFFFSELVSRIKNRRAGRGS